MCRIITTLAYIVNRLVPFVLPYTSYTRLFPVRTETPVVSTTLTSAARMRWFGGRYDGSASKTPISIPYNRDLTFSDTLLRLAEGYSHVNVIDPENPLAWARTCRNRLCRYLQTLQRTGSIRCLNCIRQLNPESISGGGESAQIHFQFPHIRPALYNNGWSLCESTISQGRVCAGQGDK